MTPETRPETWKILAAKKAFEQAVIQAAVDLGATLDTDRPWLRYYKLETKAGLLWIMAVPETEGPGGFVALRFEDVDRAKQLLPSGLNLNPYSGKWNLHLFGVKDPTAINQAVNNHIRKVMP